MSKVKLDEEEQRAEKLRATAIFTHIAVMEKADKKADNTIA